MALDQTANFVRGNTDAAVNSTQTTISVVDASIYPDPTAGEYNLVIWDAETYPRPDQDTDVEIMRVTARDTTNNDLTVTRGQEGTTGASHPSGAALQLSPTAKVFGDIAPTDQAVEDFTTNSTTSGEVPTSQGDGTLLMESAGGGGQRGTLDGNSPFTGTGQSSYTFNLADTYDKWEFDITVTSTGNLTGVDLQVEGDTGSNYTFYGPDGGTTSSASSINFTVITGTSGDEVHGTAELSGRWGSIFILEDGMQGGRANDFTNYAQSGFNDNVTSPLTQFTLSGGSAFDVRVVAYGRDI